MAVYHSLIAFVAYPMPLCTYTCSHIHCHRFKTDTALKTFLNIGVLQVIQPAAHYVRAISFQIILLFTAWNEGIWSIWYRYTSRPIWSYSILNF